MIIREPEKANQLVCFDGLYLQGRNGYKNVWPTDIDGYIQLDVENLFLFLELKYKGDMKWGQESALQKLADAIGENGYVILAEHHEDAPRPIIVRSAIVKRIYRGKMGWIRTDGRTVKDTIDMIINAKREVQKQWKT